MVHCGVYWCLLSIGDLLGYIGAKWDLLRCREVYCGLVQYADVYWGILENSLLGFTGIHVGLMEPMEMYCVILWNLEI